MRKWKVFLTVGLGLAALAPWVEAGDLERIGHTTLTPRLNTLTNADGTFMADDKGLYAALIDPTNGYAYFAGNYLFKLDITGNLPVRVGPAFYMTNQFTEGAIDPGAGYAYFPKNGVIYRFALGAGTAPVTAAGSLALGGSGGISIVVDNSDPNPANHYGYVISSGTPATVWKVALGTFTAVSSVTLNAGENSFAWGEIDVQKGYAYFSSYILFNAPAIPQVVKIKLTPGTAAPVRLGTVNLGAAPVPLWTASIDTLHGYAYYSSDNGTTNIPEHVFKVKLGDGDTLPVPMPFGGVSFRTNEIQITSQLIDPQGGYVYFNCDNTYPGRVYQWEMNGTNAPVEMGYLQLQGGTYSGPTTNGITGANFAADGTNLPYGEVYLRSAVYDPVRGYAYIGQDSRPNQLVKIQLARDTPVFTSSATVAGGAFQLNFTGTPGISFSALATTDPSQPPANWTLLGTSSEVSSGQYQFTDPPVAGSSQRFYLIRLP